MRAVDVIIKKRDRQELSNEEIVFFVNGITNGTIMDYQAAAWAMAVLLNGMNERETTDLALAMARSGEMLDLSAAVPIAVDKHSTGGVGDKTTLVVEPTVAACGLAVGKMSGRGLGFSGGTLDKMESIPGYRTDLTQEEFIDQLRSIGLVLTGQSGDLAPADGKLYALRDVTGDCAVYAADRFIYHEQENCCRGAGHCAGCEGGHGRFYGNRRRCPRAGGAHGGHWPPERARGGCPAFRYEPAAG